MTDAALWILLSAIVALALVGAAAVRRHRAIQAVAPDLRIPGLWLPLYIGNRVTLGAARRVLTRASEAVEGVDVRRRSVPGGVDVFVYDPQGRVHPSAALLWIHGGGTILGAPEGDHDLCSQIAAQLGIVVVSVRYRLAPQHPFPAGLDDCYAGLQWLHDTAGDLGVDMDRIAVGGASGGGGLAAALVQQARDRGLDLAFQLLVYPMLDDRTALRKDPGGRGKLAWTPRSNAFAWTCYLGHRPHAQESRPYAVAARREDLSGLPSAWIGVGDLDLFHDEDLTYADRLREAGVACELHIEPGMYHIADVALAATVPSMRDFRHRMADALAKGLAIERGDRGGRT